MRLTFIGAAQTVTGSMHLLEINGKQLLLDCGLYQGRRKDAYEINKNLDHFSPEKIDAVILSHAHIDHAGNLPSLVKKGFEGNIFSTFATKDLCSIMLADSAHIQQKDVEFVNKKRKKLGKNLFEPLYNFQDVHKTLGLFQSCNYHQRINVLPGVTATFYDAGHILGSAITVLELEEKGKKLKLCFTGDLGRPNLPILRDPEQIPDVDYLICESTYGGRFHDDFSVSEEKMAAVIIKAYERKAKIIVPSFSVGRTQEIVFLLNQLFEEEKCPKIPVYVDSPLSTSATEVFRMHPECFDFETAMFLMNNKDPFGFDRLQYITDVEESKSLNGKPGPMMIISASGMAESGRILHHLANNIEDSNNIVLIAGFCAEHTLGRRIVEKNEYVKIFGDEYKLNAEVTVFNSLSAHADSDEMIDYLSNLDSSRMKGVFLVHGDLDQQEKFKVRLNNELHFKNVFTPAKGDTFELV